MGQDRGRSGLLKLHLSTALDRKNLSMVQGWVPVFWSGPGPDLVQDLCALRLKMVPLSLYRVEVG